MVTIMVMAAVICQEFLKEVRTFLKKLDYYRDSKIESFTMIIVICRQEKAVLVLMFISQEKFEKLYWRSIAICSIRFPVLLFLFFFWQHFCKQFYSYRAGHMRCEIFSLQLCYFPCS